MSESEMAKYAALKEPLNASAPAYEEERKLEPSGIQVAHVIERGHESPAYQAVIPLCQGSSPFLEWRQASAQLQWVFF